MLKTLKKIIRDVTESANLSEALDLLVQKIRLALNAEVVSVYLLNQQQTEYVLITTNGLTISKPYNIRISSKNSLISVVGRREEPINIDNAQTHPDSYQHPLLDEKHLYAFLGVPIIQHRKLYGVITVHQQEQRYFEDAEEAFLITLAAQLGGIVAHADANGELTRLTQINNININKDTILHGIACVQGIGIGNAKIIYPPADIDAVPRLATDDYDHEIIILNQALYNVRRDIQHLSNRMKTILTEDEHLLFDVYIRILDNDNLGYEITQLIKFEKLNAQSALAIVVKQHILQFETMEDDYLRERASDFRDLGRRVLAELQKSDKKEIVYPKRTVLIGEEITAASLAAVPDSQLVGIVSTKGTSNSHVAILARALAIPTVMGVRGLEIDTINEQRIIVDGFLGDVYLSPTSKTFVAFKKIAAQERQLNESFTHLRDKTAETLDNHRILLQVNIGLAIETGLSMSIGAEGVGLYRSEVPFMNRERFPSEEEQYIIYHQLLKAFSPHMVTMRTLDIGGDKMLSYFPIIEANPYLGWRGIRVTLDHPDLFLIQIRAMIRASANLNNLKILLPMITSIIEVEEAILLITQAFNELVEEQYAVQKPQVGIMIEIPAAVFMTKELAKKVDFISVGSNDLTQYLLAVDRNNAQVANLYDHLHPALLRALIKIVHYGHAAGITVSICGEMASDPLAVILLIAIGFDALSMNSASLPRIKWIIRNITLASARKNLDEVLTMDHPQQIRAYLQNILIENGLISSRNNR